jgi:hypothetical protein
VTGFEIEDEARNVDDVLVGFLCEFFHSSRFVQTTKDVAESSSRFSRR